MAAVQGRAAGYIARLWYSSAVIAKTETAIETLLSTATNQVVDVSAMGGLTKEREIIEIPVYGSDTGGALPGQAPAGTFDFTVTLSLNNTLHTGFRDDAGTTQRTFVVEFEQTSTNTTYAAFDGYIANATVNQPIDGAITMDVSIARSGAITWVDNS